ncbi:MAG: glycoside hydrolase family 31 protein [Bacteroidota bacterium]|jgi:alpha-D-xyloside xylohydrolase
MKTVFGVALLSFLIGNFHAFCQSVQKQPDGIILTPPEEVNGIKKLRIKVWNDNIIQVISSPTNEFSSRESLIINGIEKPSAEWNFSETENRLNLLTNSITVKVDKNNLRVSFFDKHGQQILSENDKEAHASKDFSEDCCQIKQSFLYSNGETLYGLGSFQDADVALNGKKIVLYQKNRDDVVPVIISTNHYGLLWDNYSYSEFNDTRGSYYLWSEVADEINYYFMYGENIDSIVSSYRQLSGKAPMYSKNYFGYIQSKQKYNTQDEIVSIVKGFRDRKFPLDVIVQDWMYWPQGQWGQKSFDHKNYPDPSRMVKDIHDLNAKIIISIWPNMTKGTPDQIELANIHGLLHDDEHLNVFMPEARQMYWQQVNDSLFSTGIDGWWADCSEGYDSDWDSPYFKLSNARLIEANVRTQKKMLGSGRYINAYALMHTKGLYEGQLSTTSSKRAYILTRSSFAGMQRYGASYWTGDVSANWEEFRMQIPAGLNFCMTGVPYWTTDIAGYFIQHQPGWWFANGAFEKGQEDEGFKELYTRWFQFAAFCPLFRAHGADFPREPWAFGTPESKTYKTLLKFTNLRYRLMPYIYSLAWKVTSENYTIMRALPFDFLTDTLTHNINDQFMFGPSFMACPVIRPLYYHPNNVKINTTDYTREVCLPKGTQWLDFWTGKKYEGGLKVKADASYETMPLFVRAGSIIPFGPFIQYSTEKEDPIEVRIYPGADGEFTLYEDENDNYDYEKGIYSLIKFNWDDAKKTLTIDSRKGAYPGMLKKHTFNILLVNENRGTGVETSSRIDKIVKYSGMQTVVNF